MPADIPLKIEWFYDNQIKPDSSHTAQEDFDLSQQVQALAYRNGSSRVMVFPDPQSAPIAEINALSTNTDFEFEGAGSSTFDIPWKVSDSSTHVVILLELACFSSRPFYITTYCHKLITADTTTAVTLVSKDFTRCLSPIQDEMWLSQDRQGQSGLRRTVQAITIEPEDLMSHRRVLLRFDATFDPSISVFDAIGLRQKVWIKSVTICDIPNPEELES